MKLNINDRELVFHEVMLHFKDGSFSNIFANKNNKTVLETINHHRYIKHRYNIMLNYSSQVNNNLGVFLMELKQSGDFFYKNFLNKNGDNIYLEFFIEDTTIKKSKGIYLYCIDGQLKYIGRCRDSFGKRINHGYGKIHPKNCYIDGQSTNCHLNSLITANKENIRFYISKLENVSEILELEALLIKHYKPDWNISLK